jgi:hypothetical protein
LGYKESKLKYTFNKSEELYQRYEPLAPSFWVMTWAYYNPDNSISLGHSFVSYSRQINHINHLKEDYPGKDGKLLLGYKIDDIVYCTDKDRNILITEYFLEKIYEMYPNIIPSEKLIKKWKETGQMPKELETVLFIAPSATILW